MTRRPITELSVDAAYRRLQDDHHQRFEAAMNSGAPIVDNAGHLYVIGELEGDECDCGNRIPGDVDECSDCAEANEPHPYPCPACGGNGCPSCGDTGERIEYTR